MFESAQIVLAVWSCLAAWTCLISRGYRSSSQYGPFEAARSPDGAPIYDTTHWMDQIEFLGRLLLVRALGLLVTLQGHALYDALTTMTSSGTGMYGPVHLNRSTGFFPDDTVPESSLNIRSSKNTMSDATTTAAAMTSSGSPSSQAKVPLFAGFDAADSQKHSSDGAGCATATCCTRIAASIARTTETRPLPDSTSRSWYCFYLMRPSLQKRRRAIPYVIHSSIDDEIRSI